MKARLLWAAALLSLAACSTRTPEADPFLEVPVGDILIDQDGYTDSGDKPSFAVRSNLAWRVASHPDWAVPDVSEAERGNTTVFLDCTDNLTGAEREGEVVVRAGDLEKTVHIRQALKVEVLEISPEALSVEADGRLIDGQSPTVSIVETNCDWTVETESWIQASPAAGPRGSYIAVTLTVEPNETESARSGRVTVKAGNLSRTVTVSQAVNGITLSDNFFQVNRLGRTDAGTPLSVAVSSTASWTATAPDWITVSPATGGEGVTTLAIEVAENATGAERAGEIVVKLDKNNISSNISIRQTATDYSDPNTLLLDGFDWLKPLIEAYNAANPANPIGNAVTGSYATVSERSGANAPNVYTTFPGTFADLLAEHGYVDLIKERDPSRNAMYLQDCHLKMGLTDYHTGLRLPALAIPEGQTADIVLEFDWAAHFTGSGNVDKLTLTVDVAGGGTLVPPEVYPIAPTQNKNELFWQHITLEITGVTRDSRISIYPTDMLVAPKVQPTQQRWHLDNLKITRK